MLMCVYVVGIFWGWSLGQYQHMRFWSDRTGVWFFRAALAFLAGVQALLCWKFAGR